MPHALSIFCIICLICAKYAVGEEESFGSLNETLEEEFIDYNESFYSLHADDLVFYTIGDWGKGGIGGTYGSVVKSSSDGGDDDDDDHEKSKDVSSSGGGNGDNKDNNGQNNQNKNKKKAKALNQVAVAHAMGTFSNITNKKPSFIVALGDNFYSNGVSSSHDSLWDTLWKNVYLNYSDLNVNWIPVLGNHDYGSGQQGVQAQLDRAAEHDNDDLWDMPATNFSKRFNIPGARDAWVAMIFVDTTTLAPSQNKCCSSKGGVSEEEQATRITNQLTHIERMLIEATTASPPPSWILMAGHYEVYSAGEHGDMSELITNLVPLIERYGVDAYFCGHDHISEHLQKNSVEYFVAGAGSMEDSLGSVNSAANLVWAGTGYSAFATVRLNARFMTVQYVDVNSTVRYSHTVRKSEDGKVVDRQSTYETARPISTPSIPPTTIPTPTPTLTPTSTDLSSIDLATSTAPSTSTHRTHDFFEFIRSIHDKPGIASIVIVSLALCTYLLCCGCIILRCRQNSFKSLPLTRSDLTVDLEGDLIKGDSADFSPYITPPITPVLTRKQGKQFSLLSMSSESLSVQTVRTLPQQVKSPDRGRDEGRDWMGMRGWDDKMTWEGLTRNPLQNDTEVREHREYRESAEDEHNERDNMTDNMNEEMTNTREKERGHRRNNSSNSSGSRKSSGSRNRGTYGSVHGRAEREQNDSDTDFQIRL